VFGNSVWSTSLVLSGFMAGLGIGNALVARSAHRIRHFLRTYALLEFIVALTGIALTALLPHVTPILVRLIQPIRDVAWLVNAVRFVIAFAMIVVPATAMGATLPVLVGARVGSSDQEFGTKLGRLYGWNTLGAVVGVIGAELVLVPRLGVAGSAWVAGSANCVAAIMALSLSRHDRQPLPSHAYPVR